MNIDFFRKYVSHGRIVNTIWETSKLDCSRIKSFKEIVEVGKKHFKNLFKDLEMEILVKYENH